MWKRGQSPFPHQPALQLLQLLQLFLTLHTQSTLKFIIIYYIYIIYIIYKYKCFLGDFVYPIFNCNNCNATQKWAYSVFWGNIPVLFPLYRVPLLRSKIK